MQRVFSYPLYKLFLDKGYIKDEIKFRTKDKYIEVPIKINDKFEIFQIRYHHNIKYPIGFELILNNIQKLKLGIVENDSIKINSYMDIHYVNFTDESVFYKTLKCITEEEYTEYKAKYHSLNYFVTVWNDYSGKDEFGEVFLNKEELIGFNDIISCANVADTESEKYVCCYYPCDLNQDIKYSNVKHPDTKFFNFIYHEDDELSAKLNENNYEYFLNNFVPPFWEKEVNDHKQLAIKHLRKYDNVYEFSDFHTYYWYLFTKSDISKDYLSGANKATEYVRGFPLEKVDLSFIFRN
jgi:hypothetical protein